MRNVAAPACALLLLLLPHALRAQSFVDIPLRQCVWHAGDNSAWAAPAFDDRGWQTYTSFRTQADLPRLWIRCHVDLSALRAERHPAIQIAGLAYELYLDGRRIGVSGDVRTGNFSETLIRSFPVAAASIPAAGSVVALRETVRFGDQPPLLGADAGDADILDAEYARTVLSSAVPDLPNAVCYGVVGVIGLLLIALYLYDRSRLELLLLSATCLGLCMLRINELAASAFLDYPEWLRQVIWEIGNILVLAAPFFFFQLARRRVPAVIWILCALSLIELAIVPVQLLARPELALRATFFRNQWMAPVFLGALLLLCAAPFLAFLPWRRVPSRIRPLAVACMLWAAVDALWFGLAVAGFLPHVPDLWNSWRNNLLEIRAFTNTAVLVTLLGLLFREQRIATQERAVLAGEMQAARDIQTLLAPEVIDTIPGVHIDVVFRPMREVGGDFYLCRPLDDGRQRILIGDVSGKGTAAAMTATLLIGAAERRGADSPSALIGHLNLVLRESRVGGFATCLCADVAADGAVTLANAGHLPPYCRGDELPIAAALPLGLSDTVYEELRFTLAPGDTLTFLSDGVVEARNASGELFGFERARRIAAQPAEQIALAAQAFGQEDDITVLTLTFAPAEVPA
jgi:phosphoserine phosphatase RsbU/P